MAFRVAVRAEVRHHLAAVRHSEGKRTIQNMTGGSRLDARARVFGALAETGAMSRAELARHTALAPSTVSTVISEMQEEQLVVEPASPSDPPRPGTVGRPPVLVALHRRAGVAVGVDFGARHLRVAVADLSHRPLAERHQHLEPDLPAAEAIDLAVGFVGEVLAEAGLDASAVLGVGMGLPGPIHRPSGRPCDSTILPGWAGVDPARAMTEALGQPAEVENDANLGALSEWMWGAGRGVQHMAYLKAASGIGSGLIIAGRPHTRAGGPAGEIGHIVVDPTGPICRCGNRGCLDVLAGSRAIVADLHRSHGPNLTLSDVLARADDGDLACRRAIEDAGGAIGTAVGTLCNLVNPNRIVVGGDLAAAGDLLLDAIRDAMGRSGLHAAVGDVEVVAGTLGARAEVLGAVALVLRRGARLLPRAAAGRG